MENYNIVLFNEFIEKFEELKEILKDENKDDSRIYYSDTAVNFIKNMELKSIDKRDSVSLIVSILARIKDVALYNQIEILESMIEYLKSNNSRFLEIVNKFPIKIPFFITKEKVINDIRSTENNFFGDFPPINSVQHICVKLLRDLSNIHKKIDEIETFEQLSEKIQKLSIGFVPLEYQNKLKDDLVKYLSLEPNKDLSSRLSDLIGIIMASMKVKIDCLKNALSAHKGKDINQIILNKMEIKILCKIIIDDGFVTFFAPDHLKTANNQL